MYHHLEEFTGGTTRQFLYRSRLVAPLHGDGGRAPGGVLAGDKSLPAAGKS